MGMKKRRRREFAEKMLDVRSPSLEAQGYYATDSDGFATAGDKWDPAVSSELGWDLPDVFVLDPSDPFERACMDLVKMSRKKRGDYSADGGMWWNFDATAQLTGLTRAQVIWANIAQKINRIVSLTSRPGHKALNESEIDTRLDLAVYSILYYAESQV